MSNHISINASTIEELFKWHCEPGRWQFQNNELKVFADPNTDFWQKTHYGFQVDNGHFLYIDITGDFEMETHVNCEYKHQYDQAGLMVRISEQCWVKTSIEFEPEEDNKLGAVVTNHGFSDWSTQNIDRTITSYRLKISREDSNYKIQYFDEISRRWEQLRLFHLIDQEVVQVGVYCCSPKAEGFVSRFRGFQIVQ